MTSLISNITFDCADPRAVAAFWAEVTGQPAGEVAEYGEFFVRFTGPGQPKLYFVPVPEGKVAKNRVHLDVTPADRTQNEEIARLTALGASMVSDNRPEFGWVTMADPEGNEFCVEVSHAERVEVEAAEAGG
ncbi:MAG TPA: VOC family protein [Streptosporangiaceae bacterium]